MKSTRKRSEKRRKNRGAGALKAIVAVIAALVIVTGLGYYKAYYQANTKKSTVEVSKRDSYDEFLEKVKKSGVTKDFKSFKFAAQHKRLRDLLEPGHYEIKGGLSNKALIRIFANGWQSPVDVVVPPYMRTLEKIASKMSSRFDADSAEFVNTLFDTALRDSLGFTEANYLSLFIPDTYQMYWTASPKEFILKMKKNYDSFWNEDRMARASQIGMTRDEVVTLASIVIEESKYEPELPRIAGVYMNRLKNGMPLQADPTVIFALAKMGYDRPTRVMQSHLDIDSPYNTYRNRGLPPGPITTVPAEAIDAVLNFETNNYLYFCAKSSFDGSHNFAADYTQHKKYAREYQRALTARQKGR